MAQVDVQVIDPPRNEWGRGLPVALASAIGSGFGLLGLTLYTLPFFVAPLHDEFGWSKAAIPIAASFYTGGVLVTGPIFGRLVDRFGARAIIPWSALALALTYAALTLLRGPVAMLFLGYAVLSVTGGGTAYSPYGRVLSTWFEKNRGAALGLMMAGPAIVAITAPMVLPSVIAAHGWRAGMLLLAALTLVPVPLVYLFIRERPRAVSEASDPATGFTTAQAMRTGKFWMMAASLTAVSCGIVGVHLHLVSMLADLGAAKSVVLQSASLFGIGLLIGRLFVGLLLDRLPGRFVGAVLFAAPAVGLLLLVFGGPTLAFPFALMLGMAAGAESDLTGYLLSRYFGLKAYAEIFGWLFGAMALGSAIGPLFAGALLAHFHGYRAPLIASAALCIFGAVLYACLGRYATTEELEAAGLSD